MPSKAREALEKVESGESHICTSGIKIWVRPIPSQLWRRVLAKVEKDHPYESVPKKTIKTVDGTEQVDNPTDPHYLEKKRAIDEARINDQGEAIIDYCVDVDGGIEQYDSKIARIESRTDEAYPTDLEDRRIQFLTEYVIRSAGDWQFLFASAIGQTQVTDPEVSARMDTFRDNVAQPETNGATPSSATKVKRLAVQPEVQGA
jgi:hypothetical protein